MDWMNTLSDVVRRYGDQGNDTVARRTEDPAQDFQQVARSAPSDVIASGISNMFRSDQTPPFAEMVSRLFGQSDPNQRAGLLNRLIASLGGAIVGGGSSGLTGLAGVLNRGAVTPEATTEISPEQVKQIAAHAEKQDPSVIDKVSSFYSEHPGLMQAAGGLALSVALQHMMKRR